MIIFAPGGNFRVPPGAVLLYTVRSSGQTVKIDGNKRRNGNDAEEMDGFDSFFPGFFTGFPAGLCKDQGTDTAGEGGKKAGAAKYPEQI